MHRLNKCKSVLVLILDAAFAVSDYIDIFKDMKLWHKIHVSFHGST